MYDEPFEVQTNGFYAELEVKFDYMRNNAYNQVLSRSNAPEMNACFQQQMYTPPQTCSFRLVGVGVSIICRP